MESWREQYLGLYALLVALTPAEVAFFSKIFVDLLPAPTKQQKPADFCEFQWFKICPGMPGIGFGTGARGTAGPQPSRNRAAIRAEAPLLAASLAP